ncbi:MAG: hypothetical protein V1909_02265, partial [Candidatus Micrarchaeota archaeon]
LLLYLGGPGGGPEPPEVCTMPAGMACTQLHLSSQTDTINISLVNGLQKTIVVTNISCTKNPSQFEKCDSNICVSYDAGIGGIKVPLGGVSFRVYTTCNDEFGKPMSFEPGDSYNGKINLEYYFLDEGPLAKRKISGNVYARVA